MSNTDEAIREEIKLQIQFVRESETELARLKEEVKSQKEVVLAAHRRFEGLVLDLVADEKQQRIPFDKAAS